SGSSRWESAVGSPTSGSRRARSTTGTCCKKSSALCPSATPTAPAATRGSFGSAIGPGTPRRWRCSSWSIGPKPRRSRRRRPRRRRSRRRGRRRRRRRSPRRKSPKLSRRSRRPRKPRPPKARNPLPPSQSRLRQRRQLLPPGRRSPSRKRARSSPPRDLAHFPRLEQPSAAHRSSELQVGHLQIVGRHLAVLPHQLLGPKGEVVAGLDQRRGGAEFPVHHHHH